MKKYMINELYTDGYERFAVVRGVDYDAEFTVHFMECDEYVEYGAASEKRKAGDVLKGKLAIALVTADKKTDEEVMHRQPLPKSPYIEAVVYVYQVIDDYSIYAVSSMANDKVLVKFEHKSDYREGDRIFIKGSVEITLEN